MTVLIDPVPRAQEVAPAAGSGGVEVTMCGVRGSIPAPGYAFSGVGGHTSCVAIGPSGEPPTLLLDAGTGIQNVTALLGDEPFVGTILLTHLHWDHVWGLPFFRSADREGARVAVGIPRRNGVGAAAEIDALMAPPRFPIDRHGLVGEWHFEDVDEGVREVDDYEVLCREIPHKGGRTFGFRVKAGTAVVAYLPDHSPCVLGSGESGFGAFHEAALELTHDADLLIHGGQFTAAELQLATMYGHATIEYALGLARCAGVDRLILSHHGPARTDEALATLEARYSTDKVLFAREGDHLFLSRRP